MRRSDYLRQKREFEKRRRSGAWLLLIIGAFLLMLVSALVYQIPYVRSALSARFGELRSRVVYAINPPDEAVFVPQEQASAGDLAAIVQATIAAATASAAAAQPTQEAATAIPTATLEPLPAEVFLDGVTYVDQHNRWNYCGPANLAMALNYWGWGGDRDDVAEVVKPGANEPGLDFIQRGRTDKNVMPYEMADFVLDQTGFGVVIRSGGEIDLLKRLIASGFPVVIEKGYYEADYTGKIAWLGHYLFVTGYDESKGAFTVQDAYLRPGENLDSDYQTFIEGWRSFNYLFMVIYPPERETEVFELLGPWLDSAWANQHALEIAQQEAAALAGIDQFFAWFNVGSSHVDLLQYVDAAFAYDQAFSLYSQLGSDDTQRPYRIMWYQTGPYWAYYYSGRYQDVINLANTTLFDTVAEPTLEESLYWRGRAYEALGDVNAAIADYRQTVYLNPNFSPGIAQLANLGVAP
jgi:hypothetical protein